MMIWILCICGAYVLGSIPFGLLLGRMKGIDIREHGSKNIGATNVGRVLGKPMGMLCFALDMLKGAVPVIAAGILMGVLGYRAADIAHADLWWWMAVAVAPVLGHMYSPFLGMMGGKGVATGFGALLAMWPVFTLAALGAFVAWYAVLRITKYVSVASMAAACSLPIFYVLTIIPRDAQDIAASVVHGSPPLIVAVALALVVIYKHRGNIARLRRGEEPQVGRRARRGDVLSATAEPKGSDG